MLIKKSEAKEYKNSSTCTAWEHDHPSENIGYATVSINGRYPETKRAQNLESEEIVFVISGSGTIHSDEGDFELEQGDSYYIEKGEKYYFEGDNLVLGIVNAPRWSKEQYRIVE